VSVIRTDGLRKSFGAVTALDGLDLDVPEGTVFGFLGPNGAGKTTTLRILTGLARPSAGRAWVGGVEVGHGDVRAQIGYLPEEPAFYGWMNPREYLAEFVGPLFGLDARAAQARAAELLALVDLAGVARRRIGGFSRGMRQRLGLAQALLNRPRVLLLDEPVSALDPAGRHEMLALIERLRDSTTVFMSSHILADVERVCDTVGIIRAGRLVAQAGRDELLARYASSTLEVTFDAPEEAVAAWVAGLPAGDRLDAASAAGAVARLSVTDLARGKRELPAVVAASGLPIQKYEWLRPTLEDVFLELVQAART
jgi:ABC-2 type transport system ATP-binding protein